MFGSFPVVSFMYKTVWHSFKGMGRGSEETCRELTFTQALILLGYRLMAGDKKLLKPRISLPKFTD